MSGFLGIARERVFSPGKVDADRLILEAVADALRRRGRRVQLVSAEEVLPTPTGQTTVFTMSQGARVLARLQEWQRDGIRMINSVESILNCHRHRLFDLLNRTEARIPESHSLSTRAEGTDVWPPWLDTDGGWVKRGDVHATEAGDVVFVRSAAGAAATLTRFRVRGIARAVLQRHVEGVVLKFYAVGGRLLSWYPAPGSPPVLAPDRVAELRALADSVGRALELEVYGGDCVAGVNGALHLIDVNDWPSYAPCRAVGAEAIASQLEALNEASDT